MRGHLKAAAASYAQVRKPAVLFCPSQSLVWKRSKFSRIHSKTTRAYRKAGFTSGYREILLELSTGEPAVAVALETLKQTSLTYQRPSNELYNTVHL